MCEAIDTAEYLQTIGEVSSYYDSKYTYCQKSSYEVSEYFGFYDICVSNKLFIITSQLLEILNMVKNAIPGRSRTISG